jgi:hypothetical protein
MIYNTCPRGETEFFTPYSPINLILYTGNIPFNIYTVRAISSRNKGIKIKRKFSPGTYGPHCVHNASIEFTQVSSSRIRLYLFNTAVFATPVEQFSSVGRPLSHIGFTVFS